MSIPATASILAESVQYLKGVGPSRADLLAKLDIRTVGDLLFHFPRSYDDLTNVQPMDKIEAGVLQTVQGEVVEIDGKELPDGRRVTSVVISDATGQMRRRDLVQLADDRRQSPLWPKGRLQRQAEVVSRSLDDEPSARAGARRQASQARSRAGLSADRGVASRSAARGDPLRAGEGRGGRCRESPRASARQARVIRRWRKRSGRSISPRSCRKACKPGGASSTRNFWSCKRPSPCADAACAIGSRRRSSPTTPAIDAHIRRLFPFRLTADQDRAIAAIVKDLASDGPMQRLLASRRRRRQDRGRRLCLLVAVANKHQAILMAPDRSPGPAALADPRTISRQEPGAAGPADRQPVAEGTRATAGRDQGGQHRSRRRHAGADPGRRRVRQARPGRHRRAAQVRRQSAGPRQEARRRSALPRDDRDADPAHHRADACSAISTRRSSSNCRRADSAC